MQMCERAADSSCTAALVFFLFTCTRERSLEGMAVFIRKLLRMNAGATRCRRSVERPMPEPKGMSSEAASLAATSSSFIMMR